MKSVVITGASGFIAGHLAALLKRRGHRVIGVSRGAVSDRAFDDIHKAALGETLVPLLREQRVDAVVHCANHAGAGEFQINVVGTTQWFDEAKAHHHSS